MGVTAIKGSFGLGIQTTEEVAAASIQYIQAGNVGLNPEQRNNMVPPEIGGKLWSTGSYKAGTSVLGDVQINARANTLGWLLKAFAGSATAATVGEVSRHTFFEPTSQDVPWLTLIKNVSDMFADKYLDCKVDTVRVDIPTGGIVSVTAGFVGKKVEDFAVPTETWDYSPLFETCVGTVLVGGAPGKYNRASFEFSNNLTRDEQIIGSYFLDGVTIMRKSCRISLDVFIRDATLYRQVYNYGTSNWDPRVYQTSVDIAIRSAKPVTGSTVAEFRVVIPQMEMQVMPLGLAGNDIIRSTLTGEISVAEDVPFYWTLDNNVADYPAS